LETRRTSLEKAQAERRLKGAQERREGIGQQSGVGKVTLKSNGDEALSDEFLFKSNGDEALNDVFS
jgi:hypothetical protein